MKSLLPTVLALARRSFSSSNSSKNNNVDTTTTAIRWGILSAGKIASDFTKAIQTTVGAETVAVATARSETRACQFAKEHGGIPNYYDNYNDLLQDPNVDVVYVASVADQHYALAKESLLAGKATVVEKPLTLSLEETKNLIQLSKDQDVFLMEGMWTRCFPAMRKVRDLIKGGSIGKIVAVQADFGWQTAGCTDDHRIWSPHSGGMTLDIGMYLAQLGQVAFDGQSVQNLHSMGTSKNGVDHTVLTNVQYESGFLQFYVTGEANTEERVVIQGTEGRIIIDPPAHVPTLVRLQMDEGRGVAEEEVLEYPLPDDSYTTWNYPGSIGFIHQVEAVGEALRNGERQCRHFTHADSLQVAKMMDGILQQMRYHETTAGIGEEPARVHNSNKA